jgi:cytoskeletal protein CcmA (bactofilin family)
MALWKETVKEPSTPAGDAMNTNPEPSVRPVDRPASAPTSLPDAGRRAATGPAKESLIAADVTIEGKIEGAGHVRIAGRFKGDVNVEGNVTIEQGAHVTGQIAAATIIVSGEVQGNISASSRVELLETGVINGDV